MNEVFKDMKEHFSKFTRPSWFGGWETRNPRAIYGLLAMSAEGVDEVLFPSDGLDW